MSGQTKKRPQKVVYTRMMEGTRIFHIV